MAVVVQVGVFGDVLLRCGFVGSGYVANPPQSAEALALLAAMPAEAPHALREYIHGDYLMLYLVEDASPKAEATVVLLTIRHIEATPFSAHKSSAFSALTGQLIFGT